MVLLPGNPAIPGIYDGFVDSLKAFTGCSAAVTLTHYGQEPASARIESERSLERLVERHRDEILGLVSSRRAERVYLLGHSLGAAVAVALHGELSAAVPQLRLVLICPFLGPRGRNRRFLQAMAVPAINRTVRSALRRLLASEGLSLRLLRRRLQLGDAAEPVYRALRGGAFFDNFALLIADYVRFFGSRDLAGQLHQLPLQDTLFVLAGDDFWVPPEVIAELPAAAGCRHLADIAHAFCVHPQQSRAVARVAAAFLTGAGA